MPNDRVAVTSSVPASHQHLLADANFAHLATVRPDGSPQSSVMWFEWTGERLLFTHTSGRQKTKNVQHEPRVAVSIHDPESPYRTLEVRGVVESIVPDPDAAFYRRLQARYGRTNKVYDADQRIVISVRPTRFITVDGGLTATEQVARQQLIERLADTEGDEQR